MNLSYFYTGCSHLRLGSTFSGRCFITRCLAVVPTNRKQEKHIWHSYSHILDLTKPIFVFQRSRQQSIWKSNIRCPYDTPAQLCFSTVRMLLPWQKIYMWVHFLPLGANKLLKSGNTVNLPPCSCFFLFFFLFSNITWSSSLTEHTAWGYLLYILGCGNCRSSPSRY